MSIPFHFFLIFLSLHLSISDYSPDFLLSRFEEFFSPKLKLSSPSGKHDYRIIAAERIYANDLLFTIPIEKTLKPSDYYPHQAEISQILKTFHVDENLGDTVSLIVSSLMRKHLKGDQNSKDNERFIKEYLGNIDADRDTVLWWDQEDRKFVREGLYYFNGVWVDNMIKETDSAISLTKEVLTAFQRKNKIGLPAEMMDESEIRNTLENIHKTSVFVSNEEGKTQPLIVPLFDIVKKGKTSKNFDSARKCKINFDSSGVSNFLEVGSDAIEHRSDCDFEPGEEYFILPRTGSSFENFLTYGQINEFETYELMEMILEDPLTRKQRDLLIEIEVMGQTWEHPFFYLDNKRVNHKLRDYFVVQVMKESNRTLNSDLFKKKNYDIDDIEIYLRAYREYAKMLDSKVNKMNSTLEQDKEEYAEAALKKRNRSDKLKRNVLLLRVFQRIVLDKQLSLANQNILGLMNLKEEKIYREYLEYGSEVKK